MKTLYKLAEELDKSGQHHASDIAMQVYTEFNKTALNKLYEYCLNDSVSREFLIYILSSPNNIKIRVSKLLGNAISAKKNNEESWESYLEQAYEIILKAFQGFKSFSDRVCNMVNEKSKKKITQQECLARTILLLKKRRSQMVEYVADDYAVSQEILKELNINKVRNMYDGNLSNAAN